MKKFFVVVLLAALAGNGYGGDSVTIIKDKARGIANNGGQPGQPPRNPAPQPAQPAAPAAQLTPEQQALARVIADLAAVKTNDVDKLKIDLMALARGAKPSWVTVQKLAKDLVTALTGKTLNPAQCARMAQDLRAVLAGVNVSATKMDDIIADVPAILKIAGVDAAANAAIGDDLKAVSAETFHPSTASPGK